MRSFKKSVFIATLAAVFSLGAGASVAQPSVCSNGDLLSNFETSRAEAGFAVAQKQRGTVETTKDPVNPGNQVGFMSAGGKSGKVGKAGLIHRFSPVGPGVEVVMAADFFIPEGAYNNSIILMDLECATCGVKTNPGVRLYLRKGYLRVDRSKVGIKDPFNPSLDRRMTQGQWHNVEWRVLLGEGNRGRSQVFLNGELMNDNRGTTYLTKTVAKNLANLTVEEWVDRFQVGLTANSNKKRTDLLVDNVYFCLR